MNLQYARNALDSCQYIIDSLHWCSEPSCPASSYYLVCLLCQFQYQCQPFAWLYARTLLNMLNVSLIFFSKVLKSSLYTCICVIGASHPPTGCPMGLSTFFFFVAFFFFRHTFCSFGGHLLKRKNRIGLKFCRTILMHMLQVEVKNVLVRAFFIELFE